MFKQRENIFQDIINDFYVFSGGHLQGWVSTVKDVKESGGKWHCLVKTAPIVAHYQPDKEKDFIQSRKIQTPVSIWGDEVEMAQTFL